MQLTTDGSNIHENPVLVRFPEFGESDRGLNLEGLLKRSPIEIEDFKTHERYIFQRRENSSSVRTSGHHLLRFHTVDDALNYFPDIPVEKVETKHFVWGICPRTQRLDGLQLGLYTWLREGVGYQLGLVNNVRHVLGGNSNHPSLYQAGLINIADLLHGWQAAAINYGKNVMAQFGIFNVAESSDIQVGGVNFTEDGDNLQIGAVNITPGGLFKGYQIGLVNGVLDSPGCYQYGIINLAPERLRGVQVGLTCTAKDGNFKQFGLLTFRESGPWYSRITPFFGMRRNNDLFREYDDPCYDDKDDKE